MTATIPPPLTDEQALIRAIVVEPRNILPRLVYADWLDDHDRPDEAALVRRPGPPLGSGRAAAGKLLRSRLRGFPPAGRAVIVAAGDDIAFDFRSVRRPAVAVRHGFAEVVVCSLFSWRMYGPGLVSRHPIRAVRLCGKEPSPRWADSSGEWYWQMSRSRGSGFLHPVIFYGLDERSGRLQGGRVGSRGIVTFNYPTRLVALAAVSDPLVSDARRRAGLPEIGSLAS